MDNTYTVVWINDCGDLMYKEFNDEHVALKYSNELEEKNLVCEGKMIYLND